MPELPDGYQPGCSNQRCSCWQPGAICAEFMGLDEDRYCPRCGWSRELHEPLELDDDLVADLQREAETEGRTMEQVVTDAIREYIDRFERHGS